MCLSEDQIWLSSENIQQLLKIGIESVVHFAGLWPEFSLLKSYIRSLLKIYFVDLLSACP